MAKQSRLFNAILIVIVIALGLFFRKIAYPYMPDLINEYLGDALWASMIFFIFRFIFIDKDTRLIAIYAILFCFLIEITQLYHAPWVDSIRATALGGLVLGFGFLWSDLLAYYIGILLATSFEFFVSRKEM